MANFTLTAAKHKGARLLNYCKQGTLTYKMHHKNVKYWLPLENVPHAQNLQLANF
jgi:hypothetical protein